MTRIDPDDPKWTAYVLGELDDAERAAVELELESSEEARMLVEELRFAADLTKAELREHAAVVPLTPQQREAIHASANVLRPPRWFRARPAIWAAGLAAASIVMIALSATWVSFGPARLNLPVPQPAATAPVQEAKAEKPPAEADRSKAAAEFELRYEHTAPKPTEIAAASTPLAKQVPIPATGQVFGTVQDTAAARVPGVAVVATNKQTGTTATAVTNESGSYTLNGLQPGTYKVSGALPGFQTLEVDSVQVNPNSTAQQDITLQVAQVSSQVQVTADTLVPLASASKTADNKAPGMSGGQARGSGKEGNLASAFRLQQGQQGQQGQQQGQQGGLRQQALNMPPPPASVTAARAPGVPPPSLDRIAPGFYNGAEAYDAIHDNPFLAVGQNPLSTFSVDVDTASYANLRRYLNQNQLPPRDAVRIEEMINYFTYDYPQPAGNNPIGATIEAAAAPWNPQHRLVRVGIKGREIEARRRPPSNLVFLVDVSGSMQPAERLPLLKDGIRMLVDQLTANDRVTVVTYAGTTGVALRPTRGDQKDVILNLIESLQAGGSTNGGSGIQLAYDQAVANFIQGGVNRVILATDGDFNVGITDRSALLRLIEDKAKSGVFLSVLGVGMGNYKDATLETLADKGHGNYAYLDTLNEARKVLVDQMSGTLVTVAKDVKVQVEFNPAVVDAYRLIGYENRALRNEDFNNDLKDAGDVGAGHTVTVLYEVVPRGVAINAPGVDSLKYQQPPAPLQQRNASNETLTVKIRYKEPTGVDSKLLAFPLVDREQPFARAGADFRFAAGVASFGMIMRDSPYKGAATIGSVLSIAEDSMGPDRNGYRREFLQLVQRARQIRGQ